MKQKFLLDECITIHWPYGTGDIDDCVSSVDIIGKGAKDDEVFDLAKKLNRILVTSDMKFTLKVLLMNHPVYFQKQNGERCFVNPSIEKKENVGKCNDFVTQYLLNNDEVIIP